MPEQFPSAEKILTKTEVVEVIGRYMELEKTTEKRALSDEQGLYLLELQMEGKNPGETAEYLYLRQGTFQGGTTATETQIIVLYCQGGETTFAKKIAVYRPESGSWEDVR